MERHCTGQAASSTSACTSPRAALGRSAVSDRADAPLGKHQARGQARFWLSWETVTEAVQSRMTRVLNMPTRLAETY